MLRFHMQRLLCHRLCRNGRIGRSRSHQRSKRLSIASNQILVIRLLASSCKLELKGSITSSKRRRDKRPKPFQNHPISKRDLKRFWIETMSTKAPSPKSRWTSSPSLPRSWQLRLLLVRVRRLIQSAPRLSRWPSKRDGRKFRRSADRRSSKRRKSRIGSSNRKLFKVLFSHLSKASLERLLLK